MFRLLIPESGRKLIDIEAFTHDGNLRWAGVWVEGDDGLLNRNYTSGFWRPS